MRLSKSLVAAVTLAAVMATSPDAAANPLSLYAGAGYARETNAGAPGGSVGFIAGATLNAMVARIGAAVGYDLLGSTTVGTTKSTRSLIPVFAELYIGLPLPGSPAKPWLAAGAGPYVQRVVVEPRGGPKTTINSSKIGFNLGAGIDLGSSDAGLKLGFEGRFHIVGKDAKVNMAESTRILTVMARLYFV